MAVRIVIDILLVLGAFFTLTGVLGVIRLPDVFGRLQASTCTATLGTICAVLAGVVYAVWKGTVPSTYVKLVLIVLMVVGTNPVSNHALCKGAYMSDVKPEKKPVIDDYGPELNGKEPEQEGQA